MGEKLLMSLNINHSFHHSLLLFQGQKSKPLYSLSDKWGSFFIDSTSGLENTEDVLVYTWSCKRISTYGTIAIPSIEAIAGKGGNTCKSLPVTGQ